MEVRPIDANAMLDELRPVSFEAEHSAVLLSDVSKMMREWVERQPTLTPQNEPERAGLYGKYTVYKNKDGSLVPDCFVLRPAKDPAAVAALRAYATATDNAELSADIINWIGAEPNEWVSVEERLPEHLKDVLALYGNGRIDIDWVDSSGNFKFGSLFDGVTHWMPLPAPPDRRPPEGEEHLMDYDKLIEHLRRRGLGNGCALGPHSGLYDDAATALSTLQAENEKLRSEAEGMRSNWYKSVEEVQKLRAELARVTAERDGAVEAVKNMAEYIVCAGRVDYYLCDEISQEHHLKYQPKNDGNYDNEPCYKCIADWFLQGHEWQENC